MKDIAFKGAPRQSGKTVFISTASAMSAHIGAKIGGESFPEGPVDRGAAHPADRFPPDRFL